MEWENALRYLGQQVEFNAKQKQIVYKMNCHATYIQSLLCLRQQLLLLGLKVAQHGRQFGAILHLGSQSSVVVVEQIDSLVHL